MLSLATDMAWQLIETNDIIIQGFSEWAVNLLGGGSMDYSE